MNQHVSVFVRMVILHKINEDKSMETRAPKGI